MNISYRILGYVSVYVKSTDMADMLDLCMREGLPYAYGSSDGEGAELIFRLSYQMTVSRLCEREGIDIRIGQAGGIPVFFYHKRHRYGLMLGVLLAIVLTVLSRQFIWRVDIVGNSQRTASEICGILEQYGVCVGGFIPSLDTDKIENRIVVADRGISWISVNFNGNIAVVELRETAFGDADDQEKPANLIASKDGSIEYVNVMSGNTVVRSGDTVKKGELLVSGIFDSSLTGMRFTRAEGKVYARTVEEFYIKIPYAYESKVYTGEEYYDKYLNFFGFSIKISKNSRNEDMFYDKISIIENLCFPSGGGAPLCLTTDKYCAYTTEMRTRTREQAQELAYFELSQSLSALADDTVLLRKVIIPEIHDDFFALRCVIVCIEDIAEIQEFEADLTPIE